MIKMDESFEIKAAKAEHCDQIKILLDQLGYPLTREQIKSRLNLYNEDFHKCFLWFIGGNVVGLIAISIREIFVIEGRKMFIEALVVDENFRGQKIGEKLLKFAENYAREIGCSIVELTSGKRREKDGSLRFYNRLGYGDRDKNYLGKYI
jgi:GNAT superfamily N-acetyltransferase